MFILSYNFDFIMSQVVTNYSVKRVFIFNMISENILSLFHLLQKQTKKKKSLS